MTIRRFFTVFSMTVWLYSLLGWLYIVFNDGVHIRTLGMPLTHFASWPHEDTFGAICFVVSFVSFFAWQLLRASNKKK